MFEHFLTDVRQIFSCRLRSPIDTHILTTLTCVSHLNSAQSLQISPSTILHTVLPCTVATVHYSVLATPWCQVVMNCHQRMMSLSSSSIFTHKISFIMSLWLIAVSIQKVCSCCQNEKWSLWLYSRAAVSRLDFHIDLLPPLPPPESHQGALWPETWDWGLYQCGLENRNIPSIEQHVIDRNWQKIFAELNIFQFCK